MKSTKRYADGSQKNLKLRRRAGLVSNPKANFHYPRASIKSRERSEMRSKFIQHKLATALALTDRVERLKRVESEKATE